MLPLPIDNFFDIHIADPISLEATSQEVSHIGVKVPYIGNAESPALFNFAIKNGNKFSAIVLFVWASGAVLMLIYMTINLLQVKRRVAASARLSEDVWECDGILYPFVFGFIKPRIFIPSNTKYKNLNCILLHERANIKRQDDIGKPVGFLILSFYWYNPLIWRAYWAFCQGIELACDDIVMKNNPNLRQKYLISLLNCATSGIWDFICPLSLGKIGLKARITHIAKNNKRRFVYLLLGTILCVFVWFILLTPKSTFNGNCNVIPTGEKSVAYSYQSKYDIASITLYREHNRFIFMPSAIGSNILTGTDKEFSDHLIRNAENGEKYYFIIEKGKLIFMAN